MLIPNGFIRYIRANFRIRESTCRGRIDDQWMAFNNVAGKRFIGNHTLLFSTAHKCIRYSQLSQYIFNSFRRATGAKDQSAGLMWLQLLKERLFKPCGIGIEPCKFAIPYPDRITCPDLLNVGR